MSSFEFYKNKLQTYQRECRPLIYFNCFYSEGTIVYVFTEYRKRKSATVHKRLTATFLMKSTFDIQKYQIKISPTPYTKHTKSSMEITDIWKIPENTARNLVALRTYFW